MSSETIVFLIVVLLILGAIPAWPHSKNWGYQPTGILTLLLVVFLIWALAGGRPLFRGSVGQDVQSAGREVSDSIKRAVQ